jgi:thiamine biosynthesis lipoprotein
MPFSSRTVERCRPLLGTFVSVRVQGLDPATAHAAITAAFAEIAVIHGLMSYQRSDSDVSRLNRDGRRRAVRVDRRTYEVLGRAAEISAGSAGVFDVTAAPLAMRPLPPGVEVAPQPAAGWKDVELLADDHVRFQRPVRIDLGGIAKGFAVDRAIELLRAFAPAHACVNAGGDLRVLGGSPAQVRLRTGRARSSAEPMVELRDGSVASSGTASLDGERNPELCETAHIDGQSRVAAPAGRFVTVVAPTCIVADALTKVVMARGTDARGVLARFGARALFHDSNGWSEVA